MNRVKGIFILVGSVFITTALGFSGFRLYRAKIADKMSHSKYLIHTIVQTGPEKEALPTVYLAELMGLSSDKPQNYFMFDEKEAAALLLKSPVIRKAKVKKIKQGTVYVDYEVFRPIALLKDGSNLGMDEEGNLFPVEPFFSPKRLPRLYFGKQEIEKEKLHIALALLAYFDKRPAFEESFIQLIDVSEATHESYGKREVVITLEEKGQTWYLRLTPHKFPEELNHFGTLKESMMAHAKGKKVVDLRLAKVAYIEEIPE